MSTMYPIKQNRKTIAKISVDLLSLPGKVVKSNIKRGYGCDIQFIDPDGIKITANSAAISIDGPEDLSSFGIKETDVTLIVSVHRIAVPARYIWSHYSPKQLSTRQVSLMDILEFSVAAAGGRVDAANRIIAFGSCVYISSVIYPLLKKNGLIVYGISGIDGVEYESY